MINTEDLIKKQPTNIRYDNSDLKILDQPIAPEKNIRFDDPFRYGVEVAIGKLRPGAQFVVYNNKIKRWYDPEGRPPPEWEEVEQQLESDKELWIKKAYTRNRAKEYPSIEKQLDMIFHAVSNGESLKDSEWFASIKSIKEKYPKDYVPTQEELNLD